MRSTAPALVALCLFSITAVVVACGGDEEAKNDATPTSTSAAATCENVCATYARCGTHPDCPTACAGYAESGRSCVMSLSDRCEALGACDGFLVPEPSSNGGGGGSPQDCTKEPYFVQNILETSACPKPQCGVGSLDRASPSSPGAICTMTPTLAKDDGGAYRYVCPEGYEADSAYAPSVEGRPDTECRKTCTTVADCGQTFYTTCRASKLGTGDAAARPLLCF